MLKFLASIFMLMIAAPIIAQEPKFTPEQREVWSMEEKYWQVVKAADAGGYLSLWDERFVGWPPSSPGPVGKDFIRRDPFVFFRDQKLESARLEPKAVQMFGDVAIAYYLVTGTYRRKDGSTYSETLRVTHTWRKTGRNWQIIGGMGATAVSAGK
jgi:ketosteroid isomerase-like protein